jgi:hypothetical protein
MSLDRVDSGRNVPDVIKVIIEILAHSDPVKHAGTMFTDRFMETTMCYPADYGYIPQTPFGRRRSPRPVYGIAQRVNPTEIAPSPVGAWPTPQAASSATNITARC